MTTMNVSLPEELKRFVDSQTQQGGEFVRELIRREQDRQQLRAPLVTAHAPPPTSTLRSPTCSATPETKWHSRSSMPSSHVHGHQTLMYGILRV